MKNGTIEVKDIVKMVQQLLMLKVDMNGGLMTKDTEKGDLLFIGVNNNKHGTSTENITD